MRILIFWAWLKWKTYVPVLASEYNLSKLLFQPKINFSWKHPQILTSHNLRMSHQSLKKNFRNFIDNKRNKICKNDGFLKKSLFHAAWFLQKWLLKMWQTFSKEIPVLAKLVLAWYACTNSMRHQYLNNSVVWYDNIFEEVQLRCTSLTKHFMIILLSQTNKEVLLLGWQNLTRGFIQWLYPLPIVSLFKLLLMPDTLSFIYWLFSTCSN